MSELVDGLTPLGNDECRVYIGIEVVGGCVMLHFTPEISERSWHALMTLDQADWYIGRLQAARDEAWNHVADKPNVQ